MKLLCCVKVVGDFERNIGHAWEIRDNSVDLTFYPKQLNCFDASAVELALRCKAARPNEVSCTVLTISDGSDQRFFKPLYALGIDRCIQILDKRDLRFTPGEVAKQISAFAEQEPQDWLLFGCYQSIGQNGTTGILTAEQLGLPCYTGVVDFSPSEDGLQITYKVDDALLTHTVAPPGILILDESVTTLLRTPTMKQRMSCASREVETMAPIEIGGVSGPPDPTLCGLSEERDEINCDMMPVSRLVEQILVWCESESSL